MKLSARNQFPGTITAVKHGPVTAEIVIEVASGFSIVSVISSTSAKDLNLQVGDKAVAVIKSTEVMVAVP